MWIGTDLYFGLRLNHHLSRPQFMEPEWHMQAIKKPHH